MNLRTARLMLRAPHPDLAEAVADFLLLNSDHFAPWDPPRPAGLHTPENQRDLLATHALAQANGSAYRWFLTRRDAPGRVIGSASLSNVTRGPHQGASLGYGLDAAHQGAGLMHEALQAVVGEAFGPLNLHRLQAAYRPENARSAAVLQRLGFRALGLARDYLFIDGAWRDHLLTELTNPDFVLPPEWALAPR
jgi:ribosomal-protein-alanine N-acetyltransferase